ncbi:hypothetical protein AXF42_Ash004982 [Apostasia shenzhenica]|uniref:Uncharacterized protein n=1 Tax=Apostasia shenzhenica TaxID=1088818 RepID=A0A2I0B862_9ASPA|nr:hypothetical protein AXF42_Ash004982 [Apostasia shenzhenica]
MMRSLSRCPRLYPDLLRSLLGVSRSQLLPLSLLARMTEAPFSPRERIFKLQQYYQNTHKHTYLKGRYDMITSVAIPLALAASSLFLIGRGVYNMSHGIGKKE